MTPSLREIPNRLHSWILAALFVILSFAAFSPALNGPFIWDDPVWLTSNAAVTRSNLDWIWKGYRSASQYYPLTVTSFWLEYRIWGFWAPGYRVVNILLHAASAFMLWKLLIHLRVPGALLAALIWAVHPIQVETVVWITERKNALSGVFFFAAMLMWLRVIEPGQSARKRSAMYLATVGLFVAAMLSKSATLFLPVAMLGTAWFHTGRLKFSHFARTLPFFIIAAIMAVFTMHAETHLAVGEYGPAWDLSPLQRFILSGRVFWFYIGKLFWPTNFALAYGTWDLPATAPLQYLWPISVLLLLGCTAALAWRWRKPGPFAAVMIYLAGIFPVIGFFKFYTQLYTYVADHYSYLPCAAIIALCSALLTLAQRRILIRTAMNPLAMRLVAGALVVFLTILSMGHSMIYQNTIALWEETLRITPQAWVAHSNLASYFYSPGNLPQESLKHYQKAAEICRNAQNVYSLGWIYEAIGDTTRAKAAYEEAIAMGMKFDGLYRRLADIEMKENNHSKAYLLLRDAAMLDPLQPEVHLRMAICKRAMNRYREAVVHCQKALDLEPGSFAARFELGLNYLHQEQYQNAVEAFRIAVNTEPDSFEARRHYAIALRNAKQNEEAQRQMKIALEIKARQAR